MSAIVPLSSLPPEAIETLLDTAFGEDRHGRTAYAIRQGAAWLPRLSFGLVDDAGLLIGTLQSWPVALNSDAGEQQPLIMVGPVAVQPALQRGGHGRALMDAVVAAARAQGSEPLMMIGDPEYYGRFWGFSAEGTAGWDAPGPFEPRRLLALSVDGGATGGSAIGGQGMLGPRMPASA